MIDTNVGRQWQYEDVAEHINKLKQANARSVAWPSGSWVNLEHQRVELICCPGGYGCHRGILK